ncbi:MAG: DUF1552 domain-containing protein [Planctomycetota bacterium]
MNRESYLIPRRSFLRGVGAALALPSLEIMSPALSYGNSAAPKNLRLCVLFKGAGVNPNSWDINGATETEFTLSKLLSPLEKNKKDVVILRNIDADQRANGGHENVTLTFMTGNVRKSRLVQRQSFDQVIADHVGGATPVKSLQLRSDTYLDANDPSENFLSFGADGRALPVEHNPEVVFNRLFKGFNNSGFRRRTTSVLDEVKASYQAIVRKASDRDRQVLDHYLQSVRDVERELDQFKTRGDTARDSRMKKIQPVAAAADLAQRTRAMLDLIALAYWTDMTRVSTLMMAHTETRSTYGFLGINDELHMLSHFVRTRNRSSGLSGYDKINHWYVQQFAYFIKKLKSLDDDEGSVFDNSIVLFGSGIKHGDYHSVTDLPLVLSGGGGGQILPGRYVKYPNTPNGNLLLKLMDMMGVKKEQYGNSTGLLPGISEKANLAPKYVDDGSWKILKDEKGKLLVKGMLKISVKADDLNLYLVQLSGGEIIELRTGFGTIHNLRIDACVGSVVELEGDYKVTDGRKVITRVKRCKRL